MKITILVTLKENISYDEAKKLEIKIFDEHIVDSTSIGEKQ